MELPYVARQFDNENAVGYFAIDLHYQTHEAHRHLREIFVLEDFRENYRLPIGSSDNSLITLLIFITKLPSGIRHLQTFFQYFL